MPRLIAIGDIHGCSIALNRLIAEMDLDATDTLVTLGDYVDRGIDSSGVLDRLIQLRSECNLIPILGNHDEMMLNAIDDREALKFWLECGGESALASYPNTPGPTTRSIPPKHVEFLKSCHPYHECEKHIFTHANYDADVPMDRTAPYTLRWLSLRDEMPTERHCSGKTVVVGHTPQVEVLDIEFLIGLDTHCCNGGWLTAMDVNTKQCWQVNEQGMVRE